ncbi:MAG: tetratricopeptide repeat protein [Myxococcota bacterium]
MRAAFRLALCAVPCAALAAPGIVPPGSTFSAEERSEIHALEKDLALFDQASKEYREAVGAIVRRAYDEERKKIRAKYEDAVKKEEKDERSRRIAAITLYEDFLRRHPTDAKWTPDVIYRLAELYFEKANDSYLVAVETFDEDMKAFERKEIAVAPTQPQQDYQASIDLYLRLNREFPNYRFLDGSLYLLGYCLNEMGQEMEARETFTALVCANKHPPPTHFEPAADTGARKMPLAAQGSVGPFVDPYTDCQPVTKDGRFNAESWTRVGEYHFDYNELELSIAAYQKVLADKNSPYYDKALYKLAWAYYRADRFLDGVKQFDVLVKYADEQKEKTGKFGSELRVEAIQYLGISFAEEDWDGDTLPDDEQGIQRIQKFYGGARDKEPHVAEVYQRLGDIYFEINKYPEAIAVYKLVLQKWPMRSDGPDAQNRIITALERDRKFEEAIKERENFTKFFGIGTEWESKNRGDPDAIRKAREFDEQSLIQAAVFHHKAAQEYRKMCVAGDAARCQQASSEYALAAVAYQKYLERFPNTKNSYELFYYKAEALYFSQQFAAAAPAYEAVRDSNLDNRYQKESAFNVIKAYEEVIKAEVKLGKLSDPPPPTNDTVKKPIVAQNVPELWTKLQAAYDVYVKLLPDDPDASKMTYKAAEIPYKFLHFEDSRPRMEQVYEKYCKDDVSLEALAAIIQTFIMEGKEGDSRPWVDKQASTTCGTPEKRDPRVAEAKKLQLGIEFKEAEQLFGEKRFEEAAAKYEELIAKYPKHEDIPKAFNNAAVAYEEVQRFESATRLYERLWHDFPDNEFAGNAIFRAAYNYQRFFEFDQAVTNYLILAESKKYEKDEHRLDAVFNAAIILEGDQNYPRAASLFKKHADLAAKPDEAAESYFRAIVNYEKAKDLDAMVAAAKEFQKRYGTLPTQAARVVESLYKMAVAYDERRDNSSAEKLMQQTTTEFRARRLAPASDAAEWAARAAFWLAERRFVDFQKLTIKGELADLPKQRDRMAGDAKQVGAQYKAIQDYKRVNWTLAAMTREGAIYEHFAKSYADGFRNAPMPKDMKKALEKAKKAGMTDDEIQGIKDELQVQIDEKLAEEITPIEDTVQKLYKLCLDAAARFGVSNEWTLLARTRLNAYKPDQFPLLKEEKIEYQLD